MSRPHRSSLALILPTLALATALAGCTLHGSGTQASEVRELQPFDRVDLGGAFELRVHVDPEVEQKVELSADDNILEGIGTQVSGTELEITMEEWKVRPKQPMLVEIWVPSLAEIDASGAADIQVEGLHGERFELDVSGAAKAVLDGRVESFELDSSGASEVEARALEAKRVRLELSGAGKAEVFASEELDVDLSGAAQVRYWGEPESVREDVSGAGKVEPGS